MTTYNFLAGGKDGTTRKIQIEANDKIHAVDELRKKGFFVLALKNSGQIGPINFEKIKRFIESRLGPEMKGMDRMMFTAHLASMLKTGVPIVEAIKAFVDSKGRGRTRRMFEQIIADLEAGVPLSHAFAKFPKTFSPIYTQIISSGESMGTLGETLEYLSEQLRKDHKLTSRVRGAMIYPAVIVTIMILVIGFITFSVVPKLLTFTQNVGTKLPASTQALINITSFISRYGLILVVGAVAGFIIFVRILKTKRGRDYFDKFLLTIPFVGELNRKFNIARFSRLLGAFYHYGIPLPTAFSILSTALPNVHYQYSANRLKNRMARGLALSNALDGEKEIFFPKIMIRVIRSAEKSATVDDTLWRLADYNESELENSLKNLTTIIEPVLILILGVAVMGIALAVVVPIYQITTSFG